MDEIKTKKFNEFLAKLPVTGKALIVTPEPRETIVKSARNIEGVKASFVGTLNVYDLLNASRVVVDKAAVARLEEVYAG